MTDDPIDDLIAALNTFEPARDDTDNVVRLYDIFRDFRVLPQRDRAMPAMFSLLERFPDAEFGSPGPLVQEVEAIPGYLPLLRDSLRRQPTHLTVWMANRLLNTELPANLKRSVAVRATYSTSTSPCFRADPQICRRVLEPSKGQFLMPDRFSG